MTSIFISYRREDAGGHAGRLCDRLSDRFGSDRVFMDVQDIRPGEDFPQSIDRTLSGCTCVLAVIGPHWLELLRARGTGDDFVKREISTALQKGITVVPVLVGNAKMPAPAELPPELSALSHRHAFEIRDERFDDDAARLETLLDQNLSSSPRTKRAGTWWQSRALQLALVAVALVAAGGAYLLVTREPPAAAVEQPPQIDGVWIAEMQKPGQPIFRIRLRLGLVGDQVTGVVEYPTGDGPITQGELKGRLLRFQTEHTPQFESAPATIRFVAEITDEGIRLTATDPGGVSTGLAKRSNSP